MNSLNVQMNFSFKTDNFRYIIVFVLRSHRRVWKIQIATLITVVVIEWTKKGVTNQKLYSIFLHRNTMVGFVDVALENKTQNDVCVERKRKHAPQCRPELFLLGVLPPSNKYLLCTHYGTRSRQRRFPT